MELASALLTVRIIGGATAACAGLGIVATAATARNVLRGQAADLESSAPLFRQMFFTFSAISLSFNILLGFIAAALLLGAVVAWWQFAAVFMVPVIYIFCLGAMWRHPRLGLSISTATGFGNIGIMIPFLCLLPLWGPIALWLAA